MKCIRTGANTEKPIFQEDVVKLNAGVKICSKTIRVPKIYVFMLVTFLHIINVFVV